MTGLTPAEEAVLAYVREHGPEPVTVPEIVAATGLGAARVKRCLYALHNGDRIVLCQRGEDWCLTDRYVIRVLDPQEENDGAVSG